MAGLGARLFPSFTKLTSAQVNGYLMDQTVMRFATTAARDVAFGGASQPALAEGMVCYLDDTNSLMTYTGAVWVNAINTASVQSSAITTGLIASNAVEASKIASDAVTTAKILDLNVTTGKLAAGAVTAEKLASALPRGVVARTSVTADSSAASGTQVSIFPTVTFSAVANRLYMVHASCYLEVADDVTGTFFANLIDNSSTTVQNLMFTSQADYLVGDIIRPRIITNFLYAPTSTVTESFNINIARFSGSGTIKNIASAGNPSHLTVVDVGG